MARSRQPGSTFDASHCPSGSPSASAKLKRQNEPYIDHHEEPLSQIEFRESCPRLGNDAGTPVGICRAHRPQLAQYGNMCGPSTNDPCYEPALKGGFPVAYLFDAPGVSVEHQLSFGEDDLFLGALTLDIALYYAIALLVIVVVTRSRA